MVCGCGRKKLSAAAGPRNTPITTATQVGELSARKPEISGVLCSAEVGASMVSAENLNVDIRHNEGENYADEDLVRLVC